MQLSLDVYLRYEFNASPETVVEVVLNLDRNILYF